MLYKNKKQKIFSSVNDFYKPCNHEIIAYCQNNPGQYPVHGICLLCGGNCRLYFEEDINENPEQFMNITGIFECIEEMIVYDADSDARKMLRELGILPLNGSIPINEIKNILLNFLQDYKKIEYARTRIKND